ncbi:hypothetical protein L3Q82_012480, partial [Scortum barcoo]
RAETDATAFSTDFGKKEEEEEVEEEKEEEKQKDGWRGSGKKKYTRLAGKSPDGFMRKVELWFVPLIICSSRTLGMTFVASNRMEWLLQRCLKEVVLHSVCRSVLLMLCLRSGADYKLVSASKPRPIVIYLSALKSLFGDFDIMTLLSFGCTHATPTCDRPPALGPGRVHVPRVVHRSIGVRLHSALTGSYVPGHHSVLLVNSPNERLAKDIGRYYWKGEIQDASEILMLVKTKTSRIQQIIEYVRSVHPYANPEVLSFPVEDGSLAYMKWMDEAMPDD